MMPVYIAEGRLIRICPKKLEAKDLKDNLMRNRRLFVFIIGLEIFLQHMANNDTERNIYNLWYLAKYYIKQVFLF